MPTPDANGSYAFEYIFDVSSVCHQRKQPACLPTQTRAFTLRKSAPDPVTLAVCERVLQAIQAYIARNAYALG